MRAFVIAMTNEAEAIRSFVRADDLLLVCGIGKVNAAASTQRAIDSGATEIVNVGLCGGFSPSMKIGDVYEVDRAVEYDFDLAKLNGTRVGVHNERTSPYFTCITSGRFPTAVLATGDHFNDSDVDLPLFADLGCALRDMEGAAVAHICERNCIPCRLVKCVANVQGRGSMTGQYSQNLDIALSSLSRAMRDLL